MLSTVTHGMLWQVRARGGIADLLAEVEETCVFYSDPLDGHLILRHSHQLVAPHGRRACEESAVRTPEHATVHVIPHYGGRKSIILCCISWDT